MVTRTQVLGGRYVLGVVLGTGGMATVWRARDEVLGREVAVKVLSPQFAADAGFVARFEREARHAARLSHPRLVTVFDCGIDDGTAFIVMELVAGRTVRQVLGEAGIVPPAQAAGIAAAVCEGLEVAHAAGLVHRDIKPANIVVSGGEVKVLDFGIVRAEGAAGLTRTQAVLGTAAYLSPEQASGRPAGPQSDLYSLGCVLFEMLTGQPPFNADSAVGRTTGWDDRLAAGQGPRRPAARRRGSQGRPARGAESRRHGRAPWAPGRWCPAWAEPWQVPAPDPGRDGARGRTGGRAGGFGGGAAQWPGRPPRAGCGTGRHADPRRSSSIRG